MDPYQSVLMVILALVLVLLNGFFVLSEFAIVKVRRSKLEELVKNGSGGSAKLALKISNSLDSYLSATQLGITLSSLALGWIGEPAIATLFNSLFIVFVGEENLILAHTFSFVVAFTLITLLHVVLGELVPKSIAIAKAEHMALFIARPLHYFWILLYPFIRLFEMLSGFVLSLIGVRPATEHEIAHSDEELKIIVGESLKGGFIDSVEGEIIKNAVDFSDTVAKEIMTPRKDMICLDADESYEENLKVVMETNHTRYPYYKESKDNILGMIHIRDLLQDTLKETHDLSLLVRQPLIVPENTSISEILKKMNKEQIHTALVVDEYGGTSGLLTMEDIIEEIVGEISDEYDCKNEEIVQIDEKTYRVNGMLGLEEIEEKIGVKLSDEYEHVTLGGYVFNLLGSLPVVGEAIEDEMCLYEVLEVDGARIKELKVTKKEQQSQEED
ncbi:hemolysin family protein [Helicobacter kayseriensis]|uniref:hemolysin family protein n=1 Tax=Helicobacter kayseriensis TaxID=2905877 RepID=UPI001E46B168|nr:hemolysin family protein [Helicobacter kayseriensis]MCE3046488.1 hemolysin family protein [Helicobacter kayseriensis]MCE3048209.1 hemolysin family protein [Helicobacter kayseriensis]